MNMGSNIHLKDRLIRKTADKAINISKKNITSNTSTVRTENPVKYKARYTATDGTKKATFYVKKDMLEKLYNFAYWERHNMTEAFNTVLADGLKGKNTRDRGK